jgi:hypothetical protein
MELATEELHPRTESDSVAARVKTHTIDGAALAFRKLIYNEAVCGSSLVLHNILAFS